MILSAHFASHLLLDVTFPTPQVTEHGPCSCQSLQTAYTSVGHGLTQPAVSSWIGRPCLSLLSSSFTPRQEVESELLSHFRFLVLWPLPHVTLHSVQASQLPHMACICFLQQNLTL